VTAERRKPGPKPKPFVTDYRRFYGGKRLHVIRAEKALGKPLPKGAEVHHADGSKADDAPLVICENREYHFLLHVRMRVKRAGGNPNTQRLCGMCGKVKLIEEMRTQKIGGRVKSAVKSECLECCRAYAKAKYHADLEGSRAKMRENAAKHRAKVKAKREAVK